MPARGLWASLDPDFLFPHSKGCRMTAKLRRVTATTVTGLGLLLTLLPAGQAQAQAPKTTRVPCNDIAALKTAINNANAGTNTDGGSIVLASRCIYSLTAADNTDDGLPEITGNVRISGDRSTIQRGPGANGPFRVFHVKQGGSLSLKSLTVRGGSAFNATGRNGGGIFSEQGKVTLTDVTVRNNSSAFLGGGIWNNRGTLVLKDTEVRNNTGVNAGGVATNGTMTMRGGSLSDNTAVNWGGGLANAGRTTLHHVSASGNEAEVGGGLMPLDINGRTGPLRANFTQVRGNTAVTGGGILVGSDEPTTLYRSTVTRNTATGGPGSGGGIGNFGADYEIITTTGAEDERTSKAGAAQALPKVDLIRSAVFKNTPENCAPPNSVPRCDAVGSAPSKNETKPGRS